MQLQKFIMAIFAEVMYDLQNDLKENVFLAPGHAEWQ